MKRKKTICVAQYSNNIKPRTFTFFPLHCETTATVGYWCQTIHKKFLRRFDTIFGLKMMMKCVEKIF